MRKLLLAAALILPPLAGDALDLTPIPGVRKLEAFSIPILRFTDGEENVTYQPPAKWRITGGDQLLELYPDSRTDAHIQFRVSAMAPADADSREDLDAWCRRFLPKDAGKPACEGENPSPFTLHARPSREYLYNYAADGCRLATAVAVVDLTPRERLTVVITARTGDFKTVRDEILRSLFTMSWGE